MRNKISLYIAILFIVIFMYFTVGCNSSNTLETDNSEMALGASNNGSDVIDAALAYNKLLEIEQRITAIEETDSYQIIKDLLARERSLFDSADRSVEKMLRVFTVISLLIGLVTVVYPIVSFISERNRFKTLDQRLDKEEDRFNKSLDVMNQRLLHLQEGAATLPDLSAKLFMDVSDITEQIEKNENLLESEADLGRIKQVCIELAGLYLNIGQWYLAKKYIDYNKDGEYIMEHVVVDNEADYAEVLSRYLGYSDVMDYRHFPYKRYATLLQSLFEKLECSEMKCLTETEKCRIYAIWYVTFCMLPVCSERFDPHMFNTEYTDKGSDNIDVALCKVVNYTILGKRLSQLDFTLNAKQKELIIQKLNRFSNINLCKRVYANLEEV